MSICGKTRLFCPVTTKRSFTISMQVQFYFLVPENNVTKFKTFWSNQYARQYHANIPMFALIAVRFSEILVSTEVQLWNPAVLYSAICFNKEKNKIEIVYHWRRWICEMDEPWCEGNSHTDDDVRNNCNDDRWAPKKDLSRLQLQRKSCQIRSTVNSQKENSVKQTLWNRLTHVWEHSWCKKWTKCSFIVFLFALIFTYCNKSFDLVSKAWKWRRGLEPNKWPSIKTGCSYFEAVREIYFSTCFTGFVLTIFYPAEKKRFYRSFVHQNKPSCCPPLRS